MLKDRVFWRDTLARIGRQVVQTVIPILMVAVANEGLRGVNVPDVLIGAGLAALITLARAITGFQAPAGASFAVDAADRAAAAAAGTLLALLTTDGFDMVHANLSAIIVAVLGSAAMALLAMFTNTPSTPPATPTPVEEIVPEDGPSEIRPVAETSDFEPGHDPI